MLVYVTKYALTTGILEREVEPTNGHKLCWEVGVEYPCPLWLGRDCFESRDDAVTDAEKRRVRKITSVKKQLAKLETMTF